MSCPKFARLKEGSLTLPTEGYRWTEGCLDEALAMELKGWVWEVVKIRKTSAGVEVSYRAIPQGDWEVIRQTPRRFWPLVPQAVRRSERAQRRQMWGRSFWAGLAILAFVGIVSEGARWADLQSRIRSLAVPDVAEKAATTTQPLPQNAWVQQMNALRAQAQSKGLTVAYFEWNKSQFKVAFADKDAAVQKDVLVGLGFAPKKEGVQWVARN